MRIFVGGPQEILDALPANLDITPVLVLQDESILAIPDSAAVVANPTTIPLVLRTFLPRNTANKSSLFQLLDGSDELPALQVRLLAGNPNLVKFNDGKPPRVEVIEHLLRIATLFQGNLRSVGLFLVVSLNGRPEVIHLDLRTPELPCALVNLLDRFLKRLKIKTRNGVGFFESLVRHVSVSHR